MVGCTIPIIKEKNVQKIYNLIPNSLPDEMKESLKSSVDNFAKEDSDLEKIEDYVSKVNSDDINISYYGLNRCRKLLSNAKQSIPTESLIDLILKTNVHIKVFDIAKNNSIPLLKYEALWIVCNIGCGTQKQIQNILDNDGINILFLALESEYDEIIELGVWALANISGDNVQFRDLLLNQGIVEPLIKLAMRYITDTSDVFKTIVWAISNLARGKPTPKIYQKELMSILSEIINNIEDEELLIDACWGLSYLSEQENHIDTLIGFGIVDKLALLLQSEKQSLVIPALRIIGNILTGNEEQTNHVLNTGVLSKFEILLKHKNKAIRREICWSLSNIAAGTAAQVKQIIRNDSLLSSLFEELEKGTPEIKKEIAFILSNSVIYAELKDLDHLVMSHGLIQKLSSLLDMSDKTVIQVSLEGIFEFLKRFQHDEKFEIYKQIIKESNLIEKVEQKQTHSSNVIYENSIKILNFLDPEEFI
ncbi:unnamed protein product (macronuclear) [Paramecium tetraurelia]|uniref:Importin subunit alpha n=1 Tax=Paramecium tetraurelia TaxID=5888 RepID=A0BKV3_PARTE|nr:uncharacterized protein GSPATT00029801001 [Paramecium tetraurelia]CAK59170.1 unnamed protein product [Paramecium tetraurelia]|eukprot:XP_001426568.1 hypothetical protein (macronuclear) [Paramecium tetraurelia strain d4-2]